MCEIKNKPPCFVPECKTCPFRDSCKNAQENIRVFPQYWPPVIPLPSTGDPIPSPLITISNS